MPTAPVLHHDICEAPKTICTAMGIHCTSNASALLAPPNLTITPAVDISYQGSPTPTGSLLLHISITCPASPPLLHTYTPQLASLSNPCGLLPSAGLMAWAYGHPRQPLLLLPWKHTSAIWRNLANTSGPPNHFLPCPNIVRPKQLLPHQT